MPIVRFLQEPEEETVTVRFTEPTVTVKFVTPDEGGFSFGGGKPSEQGAGAGGSYAAPTVLSEYKAGLKGSIPGMAYTQQLPEAPMPERNVLERTARGAGQITGDIPFYALGGAIGGPGGAFALPAGIRKVLMDTYEKGQAENFTDFKDRLGGALKETGKGYLTGRAVGMAGKYAPGATKFPAELTTLTTLGTGFEGEIPTAQDFIDNAILLGGLHGIKKGTKALRTHYAKTGEHPKQVVENIEKHKPPETPVIKLTRLIKKAKPARKVTEQLKHEELKKRVKVASDILEKGEGKEAFKKSTAALKSKLPVAEYAAPEVGLTPKEITGLYNTIKNSKLRYFEKLNTNTALTKTLSGEIPTRGEIKIIENMFGKDLAEAILSKRSLGAKVYENMVDTANIPRTIKASFDWSACLRQAIISGVRHPKIFAKSFAQMAKATLGEKYAVAIDEAMQNNKYAELRRNAGVFRAERGIGTALTAREEGFIGQLAKKIPIIGWEVRWSERAYVTMLNQFRANYFDSYAAKWEGLNLPMSQYKQLATWINHSTGRGTLGKYTGVAPPLSAAFFSPRFQISRFQIPVDLLTSSPEIRKIIAADLVSYVVAGLTANALIDMSDTAVDVEIDPRSSDFGKIKIGNTRYEFWAGYQPIVRYVAQMITGERKSTAAGRIINIDRFNTFGRYIQSKLSPVVGLGVDILKGQTFTGEEISLEPSSIATQAYHRLVPMFIEDVVDAIRYQGLDMGGYAAIPAFLGGSVQTWPEPPWKEVENYKDYIAQENFGKEWNKLGPKQQEALWKFHPEIEQKEREARAQRKGAPPIQSIVEEQAKVGMAIQEKLPQFVQEELATLNLPVSGLSRRIGTMWYLNDERYNHYQQIVQERLNRALPITIKSQRYQNLPYNAKITLLKDIMNKIKSQARKILEDEANRGRL